MDFITIIVYLLLAVLIGFALEWRSKKRISSSDAKKQGPVAFWYFIPSLALAAFFGLGIGFALLLLLMSAGSKITVFVFWLFFLAVLFWNPVTALLLDWNDIRITNKKNASKLTSYIVLLEIWMLIWVFVFYRFQDYWIIRFFALQLALFYPLLLPRKRILTLFFQL